MIEMVLFHHHSSICNEDWSKPAFERVCSNTRYIYYSGGGYIFQEDNAPTHKANLVKRYFKEKNTVPIIWPMYSPDLSPIDNCWSLVKMRLQKEIH